MPKPSPLKAITNRAKQIRKQHPNKSWKAAVKAAGAEYRSGKKKVIKKSKRTTMPKRKKSPVRSTPKKQTAARLISRATDMLSETLGKLETQKIQARTKTLKKKKGHEISKVRAQIRNLSKL